MNISIIEPKPMPLMLSASRSLVIAVTALLVSAFLSTEGVVGDQEPASTSADALINYLLFLSPTNVRSNTQGDVVGLRLPAELLGSAGMVGAIARLDQLEEITLVGKPNDPTSIDGGLEQLLNTSAFTKLRVSCLREGVPLKIVALIAKNTNITSLFITGAELPRGGLTYLAAMTNLTELTITFAKQLNDDDVRTLLAVPHLRRLEISSEALTRAAAKSLHETLSLTNVVLRGRSWRTNWYRASRVGKP